jgi:hypothetical protein
MLPFTKECAAAGIFIASNGAGAGRKRHAFRITYLEIPLGHVSIYSRQIYLARGRSQTSTSQQVPLITMVVTKQHLNTVLRLIGKWALMIVRLRSPKRAKTCFDGCLFRH